MDVYEQINNNKMEKENKFINAEIPVSNKEEAELAAKKAVELGYRANSYFLNYGTDTKYLTLINNGRYGFYAHIVKAHTIIPLSDFLNQTRTETVTLENGEKWRVKLIEKVREEPMSAEEFFYGGDGLYKTTDWMERYAQYRLEFEREKQQQ